MSATLIRVIGVRPAQGVADSLSPDEVITMTTNPCSAHLSEPLDLKRLVANRFCTFGRANWHRYLNHHKTLRREICSRCAESPDQRPARPSFHPDFPDQDWR